MRGDYYATKESLNDLTTHLHTGTTLERVDLPPSANLPPGAHIEPNAGSRQGITIGRGTDFERNFRMRPVRRFRRGVPPASLRGFRTRPVRTMHAEHVMPHRSMMPGHPHMLHIAHVEQEEHPSVEIHAVQDIKEIHHTREGARYETHHTPPAQPKLVVHPGSKNHFMIHGRMRPIMHFSKIAEHDPEHPHEMHRRPMRPWMRRHQGAPLHAPYPHGPQPVTQPIVHPELHPQSPSSTLLLAQHDKFSTENNTAPFITMAGLVYIMGVFILVTLVTAIVRKCKSSICFYRNCV